MTPIELQLILDALDRIAAAVKSLKPLLPDRPRDERPPLLEMPVESLDLSTRARQLLQFAKITTIGELVTKYDRDLLRIQGFGKTTLREVKRELCDLGLSLGMKPLELAATPQPSPPAAPPPDSSSPD